MPSATPQAQAPQAKLELDCLECKIVGSSTALVMGSYLFYASKVGRTRSGGKVYRFFLQAFGSSLIYISAARWLYLPPFHNVLKKRV